MLKTQQKNELNKNKTKQNEDIKYVVFGLTKMTFCAIDYFTISFVSYWL